MLTLRPIGHHTVESLNASNAIRRAILADARKPGGGTTVDGRGGVNKLTVRNASPVEPTPLRSPDLVRAATRAAAPVSHATCSTPCTHLPKAPLSDDSWLRFVRHLQDEGRTPGAMHDDPATGVVYSTNVRPRAVTSFLRQSKAQTDLSPPPQADALASRRSPRALTLEITPAARLSSASEDEGIGLGSSPGEPSSPAAMATPETPVVRPDGICMTLCDWDVQAASEDDGHGSSQSLSPASSDEEGSVWRGHWAGLDGWRLPPSARNVDVIRNAASLTEKTALPAPVPGAFVAPSESGSSAGSVDDDIPESWLDENESIDPAAVDSSDDEWEPEVIAFAGSFGGSHGRSWLHVSDGGASMAKAPPAEPLVRDVVEEGDREVLESRQPVSVEKYGQHRRLTFRGIDRLLYMDANESLNEAATRLALVRTKPGPGRRADMEADYTRELASTAPWLPPGRHGILRATSSQRPCSMPPTARVDTLPVDGERRGVPLRFESDGNLVAAAHSWGPLASWVDDSSDEEVIYV